MALRTLEKKLVRLATEAVQPELQDHEQVESVIRVIMGDSVARANATNAVLSTAVAALGGFGAFVTTRARPFMIITSHRVLFLASDPSNGKPIPGVVAQLLRSEVRAETRSSKFAGTRVALVSRADSIDIVELDYQFAVASDANVVLSALE